MQKTPYKDPENHTFNGIVFNTFQESVPHSVVKIRTAKSFIGNIDLMPTSVDLRSKMDAIYDQQSIGSCTTNAVCSAIRYINHSFSPSRLFLYYNARKDYGEELTDAGSSIYGNVLSAQKAGVCSEQTWPYVISKFAQKPPVEAYTEALDYQLLKWSQVANDLESMKACLFAGYPFAAGLSCYQSFFKAESAPYVVPMPTEKEQSLGGHCVLICGYDDEKKQFLLKNSWGVGWGDNGYAWIPYEYLTNADLGWDYWQVNQMETGPEPAPTPQPLVNTAESKPPTLTIGNVNQTVQRGKFYNFSFTVVNNDEVKRVISLENDVLPVKSTFFKNEYSVDSKGKFVEYLLVLIPNNLPPKVYPARITAVNKETGLKSSVQFNLKVV